MTKMNIDARNVMKYGYFVVLSCNQCACFVDFISLLLCFFFQIISVHFLTTRKGP